MIEIAFAAENGKQSFPGDRVLVLTSLFHSAHRTKKSTRFHLFATFSIFPVAINYASDSADAAIDAARSGVPRSKPLLSLFCLLLFLYPFHNFIWNISDIELSKRKREREREIGRWLIRSREPFLCYDIMYTILKLTTTIY